MVQKAERVAAPKMAGTNRTAKPVGNITRGTTNPNRMRRVDRWLNGPQARRLRMAEDPLVVDLGSTPGAWTLPTSRSWPTKVSRLQGEK